jgi:formylglycine-generating enzyme required for sulfatase activity
LWIAAAVTCGSLRVTAADEQGESLKNSIGMELRSIPPGEFLMGGETYDEVVKAFGKREDFFPEKFADELPQHRVRITKPFDLGTYEVTTEQFAKFVAAEGYRTEAEQDAKGGWGWDAVEKNFARKPAYSWREWGVEETPTSPVVNVSWNDAAAFCRWLSRSEGKVYRLPTEAEWEYACRAGSTTRYYNGDDQEQVFKIGNVDDGWVFELGKPPTAIYIPWKYDVKSKDGYAFTAPVGRFQPNRFGLYDMVGNAGEWCSDWYSPKYYATSPAENPQGPAEGAYHVIRGGGWHRGPPLSSRSGSRREGKPPSLGPFLVGFRVLREQSP